MRQITRLLIFAWIGFLPLAEAGEFELALTARNFRAIVRQEVRKCPTLDCPDMRLQFRRMTQGEVSQLGAFHRSKIRRHMKSLAHDLWPDTILEGPYHVKYRIRLEKHGFEAVSVDGRFAGYRVSFSDKAWDLDRCHAIQTAPRPGDQPWTHIKGCQSGRIHDRGFVMADLKAAFRDDSIQPVYRAD